jgi:serine/threonine protein kinase/Tol biopolymer transport system component
MALAPGVRFGPYEILSTLGAGGMGEVYKARDTRLGRVVAIKVLPTELASDPQFRDHFDREARAISQLAHPHICTLYDIGEQQGTAFLVMEYLEGETLAQRLERGALKVDDALRIAIQIADALARAHRAGIVHRDLKPANIMLTRSGVKLLDFGLAKLRPLPAGVVAGVSAAATQSTPATGRGTFLGTLQYMSPEQIEGKEADARSDIWAFGCTLYEMVTGKRAFEGGSPASVIAAILERHPPSVTGGVPGVMDRVVRRSMAKDPDERWQSALDLKAELEWIVEGGAAAAPRGASAHSPWRERAGWIVASVLFVVLAVSLVLSPGRRRPLSAGAVSRFSVYPPEGTFFTGSSFATAPVPQFSLSPDGRALVFVAAPIGARPTLWLRSIEEVVARPLAGTEDANQPFWSLDSRWVGFFAEGKLKKIPASGGTVQVVAEGVSNPFGGTWSGDDTIVFANAMEGVRRTPAGGGPIKSVTKPEDARADGGHRWPRFLPDGRHFLFQVRAGGQRGVYVGSLDGTTKKRLVRSDSSAVYASPNYLLWTDADALLGQPFDPDRLELSGEAFTVAAGVGRSSASEGAVSVSAVGTLAYAGAILQRSRLTWFGRDGHPLGSIPGEADYADFRLSPDERRLAVSLVDTRTNTPDIWLIDLERNSPSRFTFGPEFNASPVWSPDGARLIFRTLRNGAIELDQRSAFGGGNEAPLFTVEAQRAAGVLAANLVPTDWSPDGRQIIYSNPEIVSGFDLWVLPLASPARPVKLLSSSSDELQGNFSPEGRLFAYSSNESGRFQVYVQTLPLSDRKWQVSTDGGREPRWRGDGHEIYYLSDDRNLMAVSVTADPSFEVPKPLFQTRVPAGAIHALRTNYVPSRDGRRFLVNTQSGEATTLPITIVLNWAAALKK